MPEEILQGGSTLYPKITRDLAWVPNNWRGYHTFCMGTILSKRGKFRRTRQLESNYSMVDYKRDSRQACSTYQLGLQAHANITRRWSRSSDEPRKATTAG